MAPFQAQLLMQNAKHFVLSLTLDKSAPQASVPWFGSVVNGCASALSQHWKVT